MVSAMMKVTYKSAIMMKETVVSIKMFVLAVLVTAKILNLLAISFAIMKQTMLSVILTEGSVVDLTYPVRLYLSLDKLWSNRSPIILFQQGLSSRK